MDLLWRWCRLKFLSDFDEIFRKGVFWQYLGRIRWWDFHDNGKVSFTGFKWQKSWQNSFLAQSFRFHDKNIMVLWPRMMQNITPVNMVCYSRRSVPWQRHCKFTVVILCSEFLFSMRGSFPMTFHAKFEKRFKITACLRFVWWVTRHYWLRDNGIEII